MKQKISLWQVMLGLVSLAFLLFGYTEEAGAMMLATAPVVLTPELKAALDDLAKTTKQTVELELKAFAANLVDKTQFEERLKALQISDEAYKKIEGIVKNQGEELRKLLEGDTGDANKQLDAGVQLKANADKFKAMRTAAQGTEGVVTMQVKDRRLANKTLVQRSATSNNTLAYRETEIGQLPYLGTIMASLFRNVTLGGNNAGVIRYVDQNAITRNANNTAEATQKPESAITWIERTLNIEKIADSIPVSKEALEDFDYVQSELDRLLDINLQLKLDQQLYKGNGTSPQLLGIYNAAPDFVTTPYDDSVNFANIYDLIETIRVDIMNNQQSKYMPNVVLMNPVAIRTMKLTKNADGDYIVPGFYANGQLSGVVIRETSQVGATEMLVGDFRYATLYNREAINVSMGYIANQFVENTITMLAEMRAALLTRVVDRTGFRRVANITTALAALETP
jgi:HK97 family phage major capsid protein